MQRWIFKDFVTDTGTNHVAKWYGKYLSIQEQAKLDALLMTLANTAHWKEPEFKTLSGKNLKGLGEVRFKGDSGRAVRVVGCKGAASNEYIFLIGCFHKGKIYDPPSALETAAKRMKDFQHNCGTICDHEIDNEDEVEGEAGEE